MPAQVALAHLVDLALGSPEVGAVNFNVLHTLLHAMIQKLNIQDVKANIDEHDREFLSSHAVPRAFSAFSADSGLGSKGEDSFSLSEDNLSEKSSHASHKKSPYHRLEKQVSELTRQMEELNKLPSNDQLLGKTKAKESERPIADMWQYMQLKNRVDANEEGIGKLVSLVEDLMKDMRDLKESQKALMDKVDQISFDDLYKRLNDLDSRLKTLDDKYTKLDTKVGSMPTFDDMDQYLAQFVTWPGLEDALKGVRLDFENLQPISEERVVIELGTQTETPDKKGRHPKHIKQFEPKSRPTSARPASRASTLSTSGPSSELLDILERLGKLAASHEQLIKRVEELERLMELKANTTDLEGLGTGLPDDLLSSLQDLQEAVQSLQEGQTKDVKDSDNAESSRIDIPFATSLPRMHNMSESLSLSEHTYEREESISSPISSPCISPEDLVCMPEFEASPLYIGSNHSSPSLPRQQSATPITSQTLQYPSDQIDTSSSNHIVPLSAASLTPHLSNLDSDGAAIRRLQELLNKLQTDLEQLRSALENSLGENDERKKEIKELNEHCEKLDKTKADKQYVDMEVEVKADRNQLDGKVNHSLFDTTTNELSRMIKDILDKLNGQEEGWKSALAKAMEELDGKLDRRELRNLKDWLEKQLKAINNKIKTMGPGYQLDDEAAGMKRQLIQRFNCLSCDKPVDVMPHGPIPSIPGNYALPRSKSPRPYTTFELDQIRQHARRHDRCLPFSMEAFRQRNRLEPIERTKLSTSYQEDLGMGPEMIDYYAQVRQCGGNHTLTYPNKRTSKLNNLGQLFREEETILPIHKDEIDVQGADGHIYKGRMESARLEAKLPTNLSAKHSHPVYMGSQAPSPQPPNRPMSARVPRPGSARPESSNSHHRAQSAMPMRGEEAMTAPQNSQIGGSRANTPQQEDVEVAVDMVAVENVPQQEQQEESAGQKEEMEDSHNKTQA